MPEKIEETESVIEPLIKEPGHVKAKGKPPNSLNRSDSTGSASGRNLLAPTLSDPQARHEKDRFPSKKKPAKHPTQNSAPKHEVNRFVMPINHQNSSTYEVHEWWQEQFTYANSSDEE